MKKFLTLTVFTFLLFSIVSSQTITNVVAKQEGNTAVITYSLKCDEDADISLYFSDNGGISFKGPLNKVTGDIGSSISSGNKTIIWNTLQEQEMLAGDKIIFRVKGITSDGSFTDNRDGKKYKTVRIGNLTIMAENISYKPASGTYWAYGDDQDNAAKYGYLYDWETSKNVCPSGWHLTTDDEWSAITSQIGGDKLAGSKLKEKGNSHWKSYNKDATDELGFTALPGGFRFRAFYSIEQYGYWWSASEKNPSSAWCRYIVNSFPNCYRIANGKTNGYSVRCVKD